MSIFKKLFGSEEKNEANQVENLSSQSDFSEGDIFYTHFDNNFHVYKLLKLDREFKIYHILSYQPVKQLPTVDEAASLEVFALHAPIDKNGFKNPKLLARSKVSVSDLRGYHEYLRQTAGSEEIVSTASGYYLKANNLAEQKHFAESIEEYSKAIDLFPQFYEAIDNRAFSKMDLARWDEAIKDFEMSLEVFPNGLSALFSIGECYLKMGKIAAAENYFEKALIVDQNHQHSKDFLRYTAEMKNRGLGDEEPSSKIAALLRDIQQM